MKFIILGKNSFSAVLLLALLAVCVFQREGFAQVAGYGAIPSVDEVSEGGGGGAVGGTKRASGQNAKTTSNKTGGKTRRTTKTAAGTTTAAATKNKPRSSKPYDGFVIGDKYTFLNFEVVSGPNPLHTIAAKKAGADGLVQVEVLIAENGRVLSARARTGNALLHPEAERAALETVFNKPSVYGKPARAVGFLVYRFGKSREE